MSKCILCDRWAGLFTKQVSAEAIRRAIVAGIKRDPQVLKFYHQFWHVEALRKAIDAGLDSDSDVAKRAMQKMEDDLVEQVIAFSEEELSKKGGGRVCGRCFKELAAYVPDLK